MKAGQTLNDIGPQMILDPIVLEVVFLGWHLARKPSGRQLRVFENLSAALRK